MLVYVRMSWSHAGLCEDELELLGNYDLYKGRFMSGCVMYVEVISWMPFGFTLCLFRCVKMRIITVHVSISHTNTDSLI